MPNYYEFKLPAKILSGAGALEHIAHELEGLGAHAPMLMSDAGLVRFGVAGQVKAAMEGSGCHPAAEFYDVPADSSIQVVNQAADLFRRSGCDSLVAVGGGSVLDTAKGVPRAAYPLCGNTDHCRHRQRSHVGSCNCRPGPAGKDGVHQLPSVAGCSGA